METIIKNRIKTNSGTSFPEQAIFYFLKQQYKDVLSRVKIELDGSSIEVDLFIPTLRIAIEYDGKFWHKDKTISDNTKNELLNKNSIYVIRIRETGLSELTPFFGVTLVKKVKTSDEGLRLHETINAIFQEINNFIDCYLPNNVNNKKLQTIASEDIIKYRPSIYAQYNISYKENNITKSCLYKYWDHEANMDLKPENVSCSSNYYINFICAAGKKVSFRPADTKVLIKSECEESNINCDECEKSRCPFVNTYSCTDETCEIFAEIRYNSKWEHSAAIRRNAKFILDFKLFRNKKITEDELRERQNDFVSHMFFDFAYILDPQFIIDLINFMPKDRVIYFNFSIFDNQRYMPYLIDYLYDSINNNFRYSYFNGLVSKNIDKELSETLQKEIENALKFFLKTHADYYRNFTIEELLLKLDSYR